MIAHSLGNRVLLRAMAELAAKGEKDVIDHAFLWDAAVPATALSSNERQQLLNKQSDRFLSAVDTAKKITVLYSKNDSVLKDAYYLAKKADADELGDQRNMNIFRTLLAQAGNVAQYNSIVTFPDSELSQQSLNDLMQQHRCSQWQNDAAQKTSSRYQQACAHLYERLQHDGVATVIPALGYDGLNSEQKDHQIQHLQDQKKILRADMTPYSTGHGYMKIPSPDVMKYGYKKWIITQENKDLKFGTYDPTQFPKKIDE